MITKRKIVKELYKLFNTFYKDSNANVSIKCVYLYNAYEPKTDEVVTYRYKFQITACDELFVYDGWCYDDELEQIALSIYSHWLLKTKKIYDDKCNAWYDMYTCLGNICDKGEE